MKDELGGKIMTTFIGLRAKTYSYLIDYGSEDKKAKDTKECAIKHYVASKKFIKTVQKQLKNDHQEFIKRNKLILKTQQRSKREEHNIFIEEINKIDLSSNDDKRMESIDSIETCAYGVGRDLLSKKQEIKYNTIIER